MNFRAPRDRELEINLTPLIDVVFLLLIFFMVSTTFVKESEIELTLPEASADKREVSDNRIDVAIERDGTVYVDDRALVNTQLDTLRKALSDAAREHDDPVVIISADAAASHQGVIDVMDAARQAGLSRVTFPTRRRDGD